MLNKIKYLSLLILVFWFINPSFVNASLSTYDLTESPDPKHYNLLINGLYSSLGVLYPSLVDINGNGLADIVTFARLSASDRGLYITYDSLLQETGFGNAINGATDYTLYINSTNSTVYSNLAQSYDIGDVTNDGLPDIVISAQVADFNSRTNSGSIFIIPNQTISNISGNGNNLDITAANVWTTRIDGAVASDQIRYPILGDYDNDGKNDLIVCTPYSDYNSQTNSGSCYLVNNSKISQTATYGTNTVDLSDSANFDTRFDGVSSGGVYGMSVGFVADFDGNSENDLILSHNYATYTGKTNPGSVFIIKNDNIISTNPSKITDLDDAGSFNVRYIGANSSYISLNTFMSDFSDADNDSKADLFVGNNNGGVYFISGALISNHIDQTDQVVDLSSGTSNYASIINGLTTPNSYRFDDFTDLGIDQVVINARTSYSGTDFDSHYFMPTSYFTGLSGTGNSSNVVSESNYLARFDGGGSYTTIDGMRSGDINGDGKIDYIFSYTSGKIWIVFNFPHTLSVTSQAHDGSDVSVVGTVSASSSVSTIAGVQYKVDSNTPTSGWTACTASDGSFDSRSEGFSCNTTSSDYNSGSHTIYVRSYDANGSYTDPSHYYSYSFVTIANSAGPDTSETIQVPQLTNPNSPILVLSPTKDSSTNNQAVTVTIQPHTFNFNAFLSSQAVLSGAVFDSLKRTVHKPVGYIQNIWYKTYPPNSNHEPAKIIPELQSKPSIISLSYKNINIGVLNPKKFKLVHSTDGKAWKVLTKSVVDTTNQTVSIISKVGGYYSIVSPSFQSATNKTNSASPTSSTVKIDQATRPSDVTESQTSDKSILSQLEGLVNRIRTFFKL